MSELMKKGTPEATNPITSPMTSQSHALLLPGAGLDSDGATGAGGCVAASGGFAAGRGLPHLEQ